MNPEVKEKWINALCSGQYEQAVGALTIDEGYCCLGVLCDLHQQETGSGKWVYDHNQWWYQTANDKCYVSLPKDVQVWAGIEEGNPGLEVEYSGEKVPLYRLNDGVFHYLENDKVHDIPKHSFEQIAKVIKEQL